VGEGVEDLGGQLEPWAVEGGDVAPMSCTAIVSD
jgi:hypothetical protein